MAEQDTQKYEESRKVSSSILWGVPLCAPIFKKWKYPRIYNSRKVAEDAQVGVDGHVLMRTRKRGLKTILLFEMVPHSGSDGWKDYNEGLIPKEYLHIRIQPVKNKTLK